MSESGPPKLLVSRAVTMPSPTNPTPTKRPDFSALPKCIPMHSPITVKMIGIITDAPRLIM